MDDSDRATAKEEILREEALRYRKPILKPFGYCHNCTESIGMGALFCSVDCAKDHEYRTRLHKQNGGAL